MYFGYRYYDPQVGRWISPDPLGTVDGPNLYAYARNNPMKYVDYFGLNSVLDENCGCTQHGHPGWHNAPEGCVCIGGRNANAYATGSYRSKIGSDIKSAICGVSQGVVDFVVGSIHDLQTAATYIGSVDLDIHLQERSQIIKAIEQSQANQMDTIEGWMMDMLSIDESDTVYHSFRSTATTGLEIGSLIAGGYGAVKGVMAFNRLVKVPLQIAKLSAKGAHSVEGVLKAGKFTYSNTAAKHFTEFVKRGPNAGRLSRPYMKSPLTINEIMAAGKPIPDPGGIPGGLKWDIPGLLRGSEGTWELVIHPETNIIYHFNFK